MADLSKEEIIAQLRKLGINTPSELNSYLREYKTYFKMQNGHSNIIPFSEKNRKKITMFGDRRKFRRFFISLDLKFKLPKRVNYFLGVTTNFSRNGFCFLSENFNFESKEILNCNFRLPVEDKFIPIFGKSLWKKQVNGKYLIGAELIEVNKEPIWKILNYAYNRFYDTNGYITKKESGGSFDKRKKY